MDWVVPPPWCRAGCEIGVVAQSLHRWILVSNSLIPESPCQHRHNMNTIQKPGSTATGSDSDLEYRAHAGLIFLSLYFLFLREPVPKEEKQNFAYNVGTEGRAQAFPLIHVKGNCNSPILTRELTCGILAGSVLCTA